MRAVQVMFDEKTLRELDASEEVQRKGRSAVLRQLVQEHLHKAKQHRVDAQYQSTYADGQGLGEGWEGWEEEAVRSSPTAASGSSASTA
jgi:hypothetical protein